MKQAVTITRAARADLDEIVRIENACFDTDAFSRRQIAYLLSRAKGRMWVAKLTGGMTGAAGIAGADGYLSFLTSRRNRTGRIYSVAVEPGARGAGIASALVDKALEFANDEGLKAVFLEVRTDNAAAISLYKKKGFIEHSVKRGYYDDGADAYSMVLRLTAE